MRAMRRTMRIVITGASGNVGTALLRNLADSDHQVAGVVRRPPEAVDEYRHVQWHQLDLSAPNASADLRPILDGADAVYRSINNICRGC